MPVLVLVKDTLAKELGKEFLARIAWEKGVTIARDQIALNSWSQGDCCKIAP